MTDRRADLLDAVLEHCRAKGYAADQVDAGADEITLSVRVDGNAPVALRIGGAAYRLHFDGGYSWAELAEDPGDVREALGDLLSFLDAYASPSTHEVIVPRRWLPGRRHELRVSNGAVLRRRGWSAGPSEPS